MDTENESERLSLSDQISSVTLEQLRAQSNKLENAANQSLSLVKVNLIILGLFLPVVSSLFGGEANISKIFNSESTQLGLFVWLISTGVLITIYHLTRQDSITQMSPIRNLITGDLPPKEFRYTSQSSLTKYESRLELEQLFITISTLLSIISIGLFSLGVILPYVDVQPAWGVAKILASLLASVGVSAVVIKLIQRGNVGIRQETEFHNLSRARQDVLKRIYEDTGMDDFLLSDVIRNRRENLFGNDTGVSEFLLKELAADGFFDTEEKNDEIRVSYPFIDNKPISEIGDEIQRRLDTLGQLIERNDEAKQVAADEIRVKPENILEELTRGTRADVIQRYNRISQRIKKEGLDESGLIEFDLIYEDMRFYPTKKAEEAFDSIQRMEDHREYEREKQKAIDEYGKESNTHNYLVVDSAGDDDTLQVAPHDQSVLHDDHSWLYLPNSDISKQEIGSLRELERNDEIRLRLEKDLRTDDEYIAEIR